MTLSTHGTVRIGDLHLTVDLDLEPGQRLGMVGPNGTGKTTTLHLLAGLVALDDGLLEVDGEVWDRRHPRHWVAPPDRRAGVVFQDHRLFEHLSVLDNVAFGRRSRGENRKAAETSALDWLELTGLAERRDDRPADLSGGQRQRTALARALAVDPTVLLLDEPFAAADAAVRPGLRSLVADSDATYTVLATHDADDLRQLTDLVLVFGPDGIEADDASNPRTRFLTDLLS